MRAALASLPRDQHTVLVMRHVFGLSPKEIAERIGRSEGAVHGLHNRGRAAVRKRGRAAVRKRLLRDASAPVTMADGGR